MKKSKSTSGPAAKDISGLRSGRLVAVSYLGVGGKWQCLCDCGSESNVAGADLRRGKVRSCGCLKLEISKTGDLRRTHGLSHSPEYSSWSSMIRRCLNPKASGYHRYGGRGISVCAEWVDDVSRFVMDMGPRPPNCSLDRIDFDGNYEPSNCRWATAQEQSENMSTTVLVTANGKTMSLSSWGRQLGMSAGALKHRIHLGMSPNDAMSIPRQGNGGPNKKEAIPCSALHETPTRHA